MEFVQTELEKSLESFRKRFHSIRVMQYRDCLVYNYKDIRHAATSCLDANLLISQMGLNLVAIHHQNAQTFFVQSNEVEA